MSLYCDKFGDVYATAQDLPLYAGSNGMQEVNVATDEYLRALPGGGTYNTRTLRAYHNKQIIEIRGLYEEDTAALLQTEVDDMCEYLGTRSKLWAQTAEGDQRWRYARLIEVQRPAKPPEFQTYQTIVLRFECEGTNWHGDAYSSGAETMSSSPHAATWANDGNAIVRDCILTITAGSADITALEIENTTTPASHITYSATIAAGEALVIDCGDMTVQNNGADDWDNLARDATDHAINELFVLYPGNNSISVTFTGGSTDSTIEPDYDDAWI